MFCEAGLCVCPWWVCTRRVTVNSGAGSSLFRPWRTLDATFGVHALQRRIQIAHEIAESPSKRRLACDQHIIMICQQVRAGRVPHDVPQTPFDAVAHHGIAKLLGNRKAKPRYLFRLTRWPRLGFQRERGAGIARAATHTQEVRPALDGGQSHVGPAHFRARMPLRRVAAGTTPTASCGPWRGDVPAQAVRRRWTYGRGSRDGACALGGLVGMVSSREVSGICMSFGRSRRTTACHGPRTPPEFEVRLITARRSRSQRGCANLLRSLRS